MSLNLRVHEYKRINDGSVAQLIRVDPYIVVSQANGEGSIRVFIQNGRFYHEGGAEYKKSELPHWLDGEIAKLTDRARKECGLSDHAISPAKAAELRRNRIKELEAELARERDAAEADPEGDPDPDEEV